MITILFILIKWLCLSFAAIGGATGQLLEQNAQALDQISANFAALKVVIIRSWWNLKGKKDILGFLFYSHYSFSPAR